jgi:hypothetical protein
MLLLLREIGLQTLEKATEAYAEAAAMLSCHVPG